MLAFTAGVAVNAIGEREVVRADHSRETSQGGPFSLRHDSTSEGISPGHVTESEVMASEIEQLPDLQGFLRLASNPVWMRILLTPRSQPPRRNAVGIPLPHPS